MKKTQKFYFQGTYEKIFKFEGHPAGRLFDERGEKGLPTERLLSKILKMNKNDKIVASTTTKNQLKQAKSSSSWLTL